MSAVKVESTAVHLCTQERLVASSLFISSRHQSLSIATETVKTKCCKDDFQPRDERSIPLQWLKAESVYRSLFQARGHSKTHCASPSTGTAHRPFMKEWGWHESLTAASKTPHCIPVIFEPLPRHVRPICLHAAHLPTIAFKEASLSSWPNCPRRGTKPIYRFL